MRNGCMLRRVSPKGISYQSIPALTGEVDDDDINDKLSDLHGGDVLFPL